MVAAFTNASGGPFTTDEIEEIRRLERERGEALAAVREAVELAEQVEQARKRCAMLQAAVDAGVQLEELAPEYAVPGDKD
jgi:hypothetical protein